MKKVLPLLKGIGRGLVGGVLFSTVILNMAIAYLIFAPDSYPKPFYLLYAVPTPQPTETPMLPEAEGTETPPINVEELKSGQGLIIDTGTKIVNLAEPGGRKYIRVNIVLEFAPNDLEYLEMPEEEKQVYIQAFEEEINAVMPVINDTLITLFTGKTFEDVYTAEGKEALRQQIAEQLRTKLPEYYLMFVYFTEFVVQ